jgi:hypothetical protein
LTGALASFSGRSDFLSAFFLARRDSRRSTSGLTNPSDSNANGTK